MAEETREAVEGGVITEVGTFAIPHGVGGSDGGYRNRYLAVALVRGEESFWLRWEYVRLYDDYKIYMRWQHFPRCAFHLAVSE